MFGFVQTIGSLLKPGCWRLDNMTFTNIGGFGYWFITVNRKNNLFIHIHTLLYQRIFICHIKKIGLKLPVGIIRFGRVMLNGFNNGNGSGFLR